MKQYDITCPICGTLNKGLYLEETGGWMECEHCHTDTMSIEFARNLTVKIPVYSMDQLSQLAARKAV